MTSTATSPGTVHHPDPSLHVQADFYTKLARLEQDVLSGRHPRYDLSKTSLGVEAQRVTQPIPLSQHATLPNGSLLHLNGSTLPALPLAPLQNGGIASPQAFPARGGLARPPASSIDPVLLTKSDQLVRAENHLKRLRIEKALKEAVKGVGHRTMDKDSGWNGAHIFNCDQLLEAATSLIKPVSGLHSLPTDEPRQPSSPPNTNSYYSSKVDSQSPIDDGEIFEDETAAQNATGASFTSVAETALQRPRMSGLGPQDFPAPFSRAEQVIPLPFVNADSMMPAGPEPVHYHEAESMREDSYSPPGADEVPPTNAPSGPRSFEEGLQRTPNSQGGADRRRRNVQAGGRARESESYSPPPANPSSQNPPTAPSAYNNTHGGSRRGVNGKATQEAPKTNGKTQKTKSSRKERKKLTSTTTQVAPAAHPPTISNPKKRRREAEPDVSSRRASGREPLMSPIPYIKPEPLSPRPMSRINAEPPRRLVLQGDGTANIEVDYPGGPTQVQRAQLPIYDGYGLRPPVSTPRYSLREPIVLDDSDEQTPVARRRIIHGNPDLRRVASLQYARRPISPEYLPQEMRPPLTPSRQPRGDQPEYHFLDDLAQRPSLPPHPGHHAQRFIPEPYSERALMPPPPPPKRRIVVDRYGNEYLALPTPSSMRQSVALDSDYADPNQYESPTYYSQSPRVKQPLARPPTYMRRHVTQPPPPVVDLLDDDQDPYMPQPQFYPPEPRAEQRFSANGFARPAAYYTPQMAPRAASMQPMAIPSGQRYAYAPPAAGWPQERELNHVRALSARPMLPNSLDSTYIDGSRPPSGYSRMMQ